MESRTNLKRTVFSALSFVGTISNIQNNIELVYPKLSELKIITDLVKAGATIDSIKISQQTYKARTK